MEIIDSIAGMKSVSRELRRAGKKIGFVPTMGYLHEGHLSLVKRSVKTTDKTVVSIFVNPMQFAPGEDLARYPTDLKRDERLLEEGGTHILFLPSGKEMYPEGFQTALCVEKLEKKLCGMTRPTHFKGVCTVVLKLFEIVKPDVAFFGQKDAQQSRIIRRMVEDLNLDVVIEVLPIVRERDGLAMSSRNSYLLPEERKGAAVIFRTLCDASRRIQEGERDPGKILQNMRDAFRAVPNCRIDYLKILNPDTLEDMEETIEGEMLIAAAVYFGSTRLIDNVVVAVGSETSGKEARRV